MEQPLIAADEVPDTGTVTADFFGRQVLVTKVDGKSRVYLDSCPHFGGPLEREGDALVCSWHGAEFSLDGVASGVLPGPTAGRWCYQPG